MSSTALRKTPIVDALIPGAGLLRDSLLVIGGATLTFLGAQVTVPWQPVPFTLQTLSVMLCGLSLGPKRGILSQLLYVGVGAAGIPVFAESKFGIQPILGPTGGYLVSFMVVSAVLGWLAEKGWTESTLKTAVAMVIGSTINLGMGAAWLATSIGGAGALMHGVVPFLVPETLKATVVMLALPTAWKFTK